MSILTNIVEALLTFLKPEMTSAEVDAALQTQANTAGEKLDWKNSIVDLLKLLKQPSSFNDRKALATEIGMANYTGAADENIQLHQHVVAQVAGHGIRLT